MLINMLNRENIKMFCQLKENKIFLCFSSLFCLFSDINECTANSDNCDVNAVCQNTVGSHTCSCKAGYTGNGKQCRGKDDFKEIQQKRLKAIFNSHYLFQYYGLKMTKFPYCRSACIDSEDSYACEQVLYSKLGAKRAPQRAVKGQGKREVATVSTGFSFLVQLGEAKYHLLNK